MRVRERGAGAVEYLGVVVVAAILVAAVSFTSAAGSIGAGVEQAICKVTSLIGGTCTAGTDGEGTEGPEYVPDSCTVSTDGDKHEINVEIVVVEASGSHGIVIKEKRYADGRVEYEVEQTGEGKFGVGKDFEAPDVNGTEASAGVNVAGSVSGGPTYTVSTLEEAQALRDRLMDNPFADPGMDPSSETVTWGGELEGSVDLGIGTPNDKGGVDDNSPSMSAGGSLTGSHEYSTETEPDGTTTYTTSWSGEVGAEAGIDGGTEELGAGAEASWKGTTGISIKRDPNGQIVEISFERTTEGSASAGVNGDDGSNSEGTLGGGGNRETTMTATLTVNDANRATVEQWMSQQVGGDNYLGLAPLGTIFWDPTKASSDPMLNLLYQEAQITEIVTEGSESSQEYGAEIPVIDIGGGYTHTDSNGRVVEAQYAGPPSNGSRTWNNMEVCFP